MKRDFLRNLGLQEEQIDTILNEAGRDLESTKNVLNTEITRLQTEISSRNTQLEELRKSVPSEDLNQKIAELQKVNADTESKYQTQILELQKTQLAKEGLIQVKAKDIGVCMKLVSDYLNTAEIKEGALVGYDEVLKGLIENEVTGKLFGGEQPEPKIAGFTPVSGKDVGGGEIDLSKATYSELVDYQSKHPEINIFDK